MRFPPGTGLRRYIRLSAIVVAVATAVEATAAEGPAQRKTTQSESYVVIDPIYSTILDGNRPRGLLMIELGLDVPDSGLRGRVNQALPNLRDAYVRSLLIYAATAVRPWRQPDVDDIAKRLQTITDRVIGREGARVLMAQAVVRVTR
jgi:flagellar basal body-associated protein FliL